MGVSCGSSIWNHMPGTWNLPVSQRVEGAPSTDFAAFSALWLAVNFHRLRFGSGACGSEARNSSIVHGSVRGLIAARTRATSCFVTVPALLPKLLRTNDAMDAIHSSSLLSIGTI